MALHKLLCLAPSNGLVSTSATMFSVAQYCTSMSPLSALHLLPTEVVPRVHVLAASGRHTILVEYDTT
jgi:hypothetical protein